eukprot:PhM_4_TR7664/c0_g1_i1/m.63329/K18752/TNPO1, IPO2, KPNB2; transportin-1
MQSGNEISLAVQILVAGLTGERGREHQEVLNHNASNPRFCECLGIIFQHHDPITVNFTIPPTVSWVHVREIAGLTLKNNISRHHKALGAVAVQSAGIQASSVLMSPESRLARAAAQIVAVVTRVCGLEIWSQPPNAMDLLQKLGEMAHNGTGAAFITLRYLFEDAHENLGDRTQEILSVVTTSAMNYVEALECVVAAYEVGEELVWAESGARTPFQSGLWVTAEHVAKTITIMLNHDVPPVVRRGVLKLMKLMLSYREAFMLPQEIGSTWIGYCVHFLQSDVMYFAECCDFLSEVCWVAHGVEELSDLQSDPLIASISPAHVAQLLPILLNRMVYSDDEVMDVMENDHISSRDTNVKPRQMSRRKDGQSRELNDEEVDSATVRTMAMKCLQGLALIHPGGVWSELRGLLQSRLGDADWKMRESAILALGAIIHGCFRFLRVDFGSIMGMVIDRALGDSNVLVKCTAVWMIAGTFTFIITEAPAKVEDAFRIFVDCSVSESKRLQWASISGMQRAFFECMSYNSQLTAAVAPKIVDVLPRLATQCQTNNLLLLLELFDLLMAQHPDLQYNAFLKVLFQRIDAGQSELNSPDSVAVREMLYIFGPVANLLESGLQLPAEARTRLVQMCLRCMEFYFSGGGDNDVDFVTYPLHLFSVILSMDPASYTGTNMESIHEQILSSVLWCEDRHILLEALLYLEKLSMHPSDAFLASFEGKFMPRLVSLCSQADVECDAIWCLGQCIVHMRERIPIGVVTSFATELIRRVLTSSEATFDDPTDVASTSALTVAIIALHMYDAVARLPEPAGFLPMIMHKIQRMPNDNYKASGALGVLTWVRMMAPDALPRVLHGLLLLGQSFHDTINNFEQLQRAFAETITGIKSSPASGALDAEMSGMPQVRDKLVRMYRL